jgi:hypothetical protein
LKYSEIKPSSPAIDNRTLVQSRGELRSRVEGMRIKNNNEILMARDRRKREAESMDVAKYLKD